jgi:hypothetical protein
MADLAGKAGEILESTGALKMGLVVELSTALR